MFTAMSYILLSSDVPIPRFLPIQILEINEVPILIPILEINEVPMLILEY